MSGAPARVAMIGDSITEQWGYHRRAVFQANGLIVRGRSGMTARQIATFFRADLELTGADGVHLLCGVNDIGRNEGRFVAADEIVATLLAMLDSARAMGVRAWVGSLTPAARIPWNPMVPDAPAMIDAVNAGLRARAGEHGATYIDYHAALDDGAGGLRRRCGTDGLHLSAAGYRAIEPLMLGALGRAPRPPAGPLRRWVAGLAALRGRA